MKHNSVFKKCLNFRLNVCMFVLPLFPSIDWLKSTMPVSV